MNSALTVNKALKKIKNKIKIITILLNHDQTIKDEEKELLLVSINYIAKIIYDYHKKNGE